MTTPCSINGKVSSIRVSRHVIECPILLLDFDRFKNSLEMVGRMMCSFHIRPLLKPWLRVQLWPGADFTKQ